MLRVLCLHAEVVVAVWSACWQAWCLAMDGEGRRQWATHMDDGGYMEGYGFRIWTEFPLLEFAKILSRKAVKFCIYSIKYGGIVKPLWYTWLSIHHYYCKCSLKVVLGNSYWIPTGLLLDSLYWTPVYPFLRNPQVLVIPVGIY